jgi:RES domain-containing protein|tara:strand:- start:4524 stop:5219 length:696 start_codon:yes stop_codon:yes gene_type:complete
MIITEVRDRALVRLIPATYHKPPSLRGLVDTDEEMEILAEIEGETSSRLIAEKGKALNLDLRELAWGRRRNDLKMYGNTHVNASFTYTRKDGNRFNNESRGAWYCSWETMTSIAEVAFHKTRELGYIGIYKDTTRYIEMLADFIGDFPDIHDEPNHPALNPDPTVGYPEGQAFADHLRREGHLGLIYPSVREVGGRCLVVFEPKAIHNVRPGASWDIVWNGTPHYSINAFQ